MIKHRQFFSQKFHLCVWFITHLNTFVWLWVHVCAIACLSRKGLTLSTGRTNVWLAIIPFLSIEQINNFTIWTSITLVSFHSFCLQISSFKMTMSWNTMTSADLISLSQNIWSISISWEFLHPFHKFHDKCNHSQ